jgi:DNA-binding CsgD family transcriptional regulator
LYPFSYIYDGTMKEDMTVKKKGTDMNALQPLSPREREVLRWLKCGKTSWAIALILRISERTVNYHVNNIMRKLDVTNRMQAVSAAANDDIGKDE